MHDVLRSATRRFLAWKQEGNTCERGGQKHRDGSRTENKPRWDLEVKVVEVLHLSKAGFKSIANKNKTSESDTCTILPGTMTKPARTTKKISAFLVLITETVHIGRSTFMMKKKKKTDDVSTAKYDV